MVEFEIKDMPKLESPFVRNEETKWLVINKITEGMEWVFQTGEDEVDIVCMEKLNGTNISILIQGGAVTGVWNRETRISMFSKGNEHIMEGLTNSTEQISKLPDGQWFGELIGEKVNSNFHNIKGHVWIPFNTFGVKHLVYKSFHKYPKNFEALSEWFRKPIEDGGIFSLYGKMKGLNYQPEGVVFYNLKTGQLCKLRRDMFDFHKGKRHKE